MEITVSLPTTSGDAGPDAIRLVATEAERRGWSTVWTVDRMLCPDPAVAGASYPGDEYRVTYAPLETIAWAAALTTRLRFGTSVIDALFQPPAALARRLASIDRLCAGRLRVGLGQGWMPEEFAAAGVPLSRRGRGFEDYLGALAAAWGPDPVAYDGTYYRIPPSFQGPKPVHAGGPPLLIGAFVPAAAARAGRLGLGLNPVVASWDGLDAVVMAFRKAAADAGHDPAGLPVVVRTNAPVGSPVGFGPLTGLTGVEADLERLAERDVTEVFYETGRSPMPIGEQLDLIDDWRAHLGAPTDPRGGTP